MKSTNIKGLICAYYLSKFDRFAYGNLGFDSFSAAHEFISSKLGLNPNTFQNMRDEFDPIHNNDRRGWYQREMRPSRKKIVETYSDLDEKELRAVVLTILDPDTVIENEMIALIDSSDENNRDSSSEAFEKRQKTGLEAEKEFMAYYRNHRVPIDGKLIDCRDSGKGYDFIIDSDGTSYYIEIKGLRDGSNSILLTDREWHTAEEQGDKYYLSVVYLQENGSRIEFFKNPASVLVPDLKQRIVVTMDRIIRL